ncbi:unnamed protein product [Ceutorhynchus assimilis]|uniref:26S proteasome non-ATPase regulatory subunit 5 n=1 Tax=Ceutorhynchus assimilis TaxID=467358 RepID=A0A9N9QNL1_9CUCU|nr:unnamed protein product [Ceutorhynchus assimilis]
MDSQDEWYRDKLSNLIQEDLRIPTLSELREQLSSLSKDEFNRIVTNLQLPLVFDCLNDTNSQQVDLACDVLTLCLNNLTLEEITNRYSSDLERALLHPYTSVKTMALQEIKRSLDDEESLGAFCQQTSMLVNVVSCIGDSQLGPAKIASDIVVALGATLPGANKITTNEILVVIENLMNMNEIVRLRVYEMIIRISEQSEYCFEKFQAAGFMKKIIDGLKNDDILYTMNTIQILSQLADCEHGYNFLERTDTLNKIFSLLTEDELKVYWCEPGILKFFGSVSQKRPHEIIVKHPKLINRLFANIESSDATVIGISLDTIGLMGQTSQGKVALASTGTQIDGTIRTISHLINSLPTEIRVRALNCIENLLRTDRFDIAEITEKWFHLLGKNPMEMITRYAKNPFVDLRLAGIGIINALARQQWGQKAIRDTPGLIEYLLDRRLETNKECKEAKFEVIRLLSGSLLFDRHVQDKMTEFIKEGPFYVQIVTEVAVEGD